MKTLHLTTIMAFALITCCVIFYVPIQSYAAYVGPDCNEKDVIGFSPITSKVAFVSNEGSSSPDNFTLYTVSSDGTDNLSKISHVSSRMSPIIISPDGKKIVFSSNRNGANSLFISNIDGTRLQQLTNYTASVVSFFPNSTKIIFGKNLNNTDGFSNIYSINSDGTDIFSITHDKQEKFWTAASSNGKTVAYTTETGIYEDKVFAVNTDGTNLHFVTDGSLFSYTKPVVSDNGSKIIFSKYTDTLDYLYTINVDGTGLVEIGPLNQPSMSDNFITTHDGSRIYYWPVLRTNSSMMIFPERINNTMQIFVSNDNGTNVIPLVDNSYFVKNPNCIIPSDLAGDPSRELTQKIQPIVSIPPYQNVDMNNAIVLAEVEIPIAVGVAVGVFLFTRRSK